jgi:hypothetical protein
MTEPTRVAGVAAIGDRVIYFDIANQNRRPQTVTSLPSDNVDPEYGWTKGYGLQADDGTETFSDLRQHGWTFHAPALPAAGMGPAARRIAQVNVGPRIPGDLNSMNHLVAGYHAATVGHAELSRLDDREE